jgi:hypothetical protein
MGALSVVCSNTLSFNPNKGEKNEKGALRATFIQDEDEEEKQLQRHIFFSLRRHLKSFHFCRQVRPGPPNPRVTKQSAVTVEFFYWGGGAGSAFGHFVCHFDLLDLSHKGSLF